MSRWLREWETEADEEFSLRSLIASFAVFVLLLVAVLAWVVVAWAAR